ncbi:hypothetical protein GJ744_008028 [Endocarpon pusillum]|uniref:Uncharacterized protein n=1 Tax=Endocarpon pusillum TaxID=364733 RepID=A0A8H7AQT3_9EURO|nr:hypothetical protein GJ744_008028 [Endocarpon pusillum]
MSYPNKLANFISIARLSFNNHSRRRMRMHYQKHAEMRLTPLYLIYLEQKEEKVNIYLCAVCASAVCKGPLCCSAACGLRAYSSISFSSD